MDRAPEISKPNAGTGESCYGLFDHQGLDGHIAEHGGVHQILEAHRTYFKER